MIANSRPEIVKLFNRDRETPKLKYFLLSKSTMMKSAAHPPFISRPLLSEGIIIGFVATAKTESAPEW